MSATIIAFLLQIALQEAPEIGALIAQLVNSGQTTAPADQLAQLAAAMTARKASDAALDAAAGTPAGS